MARRCTWSFREFPGQAVGGDDAGDHGDHVGVAELVQTCFVGKAFLEGESRAFPWQAIGQRLLASHLEEDGLGIHDPGAAYLRQAYAALGAFGHGAGFFGGLRLGRDRGIPGVCRLQREPQ